MNKIDLEIGQRVARLRVAHEWGQGQLAQQVGVSRSTVWRIEVGEHRVTVDELIRLADVLEVTPASFFGQEVDRAARRAGLVRGIAKDLTSALHRLKQLYGLGG